MLSWREIQNGYRNARKSFGKGLDTFYQNSDLKKAVDAFEGARDTWNDLTSSGSYSDFVSRSNERTDGWYGTIAGSIPIVRNLHNGMLDRDRAKDYLDNTGLSWSDIPGYQSMRLTGGTSANISQGVGTIAKIAGGKNDLYEFYAGEPDGFMYG